MDRETEKYAERLLVDLKGLMALCSCGRIAAEKIGEASGSVIRVGRRKLYNLKKVREYINQVCEIEVDEKKMNLEQLLYALPVETHFVITYGILSYVGHRSEQVEAI